MNIILTLIAGICISVMIFLNGSLESYVGNFPSLLFIHISGLFFSGILFLKQIPQKTRIPKSKLYLFAGSIGIIIVTITNQVFNKGGVLLALSGTLAGQVLAASVMELYTAKVNSQKMHIGKILSLILVLPGSILLGYKSRLPFIWIMFSWIPGILVLLQSYMNSQNILSIGVRKTLLVHFGTTIIALIPIYFFIPLSDSINIILSGGVPIYFLIGGGFVAIFVASLGSYLLLKINPLTYVLFIYCGQLSAALVIDYIQGKPLTSEIFIAIILIIGGIILGEVRLKSKNES